MTILVSLQAVSLTFYNKIAPMLGPRRFSSMEIQRNTCNFQDKIDDSTAKLSYLLQHCQGKDRQLIEGCSRKRRNEG